MRVLAPVIFLLIFVAGFSAAHALVETPELVPQVESGILPPIEKRLPKEPLVVTFMGDDISRGTHGGELRTLIARPRDMRRIVTFGYARLVGYTPTLEIVPDILRDISVSEDKRTYTLHLRKNHKWSDGHPFTSEDFRYWWEDVANNPELSPAGPPIDLLVGEYPPDVKIVDEVTVRFRWPSPNPRFLPLLAQAVPPFIYRPAHYMKQFHIAYTTYNALEPLIKREKVKGWAALHNRYDNMHKADNPDLPTLGPWMPSLRNATVRQVSQRNPYYHRVDIEGRQLPYIDRVTMTVSEPRLIPAKAAAGETDLQAAGLAFSSTPVLKRGEARGGYTTRLWQIAKGSHLALFPNLTTEDPVWRDLFRDVRFRRALSLGIDRRLINQTLFFGLALEGNNTVLPQSPLYREDIFHKHAEYSPDQARQLLDELGLVKKRGDGIRLLPDGRPAQIVVETVGETPEAADILQLIAETWREIGIKLVLKVSTRDTMRMRAFRGAGMITAWGGWNTGIPTEDMSPNPLAPTDQAMLTWPKWGEFFQTKGKSGEPIDMAEAIALLELYREWESAEDSAKRREVWLRMLEIHAEQQFTIGTIAGVGQPIVVSNRLRNVPQNGIFSWDPGAQFGMYRPDQFWFEDNAPEPEAE